MTEVELFLFLWSLTGRIVVVGHLVSTEVVDGARPVFRPSRPIVWNGSLDSVSGEIAAQRLLLVAFELHGVRVGNRR